MPAERYRKWVRRFLSLSLCLCCQSTKLLPPYRIHYLPTYIHPTTQHTHVLGGQTGVTHRWGIIRASADPVPMKWTTNGCRLIESLCRGSIQASADPVPDKPVTDK